MTSAADVPHLPSHIEHLDTAALVPYVRNSRTHSPEQVAAVARSIQQFGFTNPVLIDAHNTIIAGHGRVMAAQSIGLGTVPCIRLAHLTDAQRRAYVIADNKLPELSGWDLDALASEVESLIHQDAFDIDLLGFGADELHALLHGEQEQEQESQEQKASKAEKVPEIQAQEVSRSGDVWVMGPHRVMCGDSTRAADVAILMAGAKANMVFTDPPYNIGYSGTMSRTTLGGVQVEHKTACAQYAQIKNDKMTAEQFDVFISGVLMNVVKYCSGAFYICFGSQTLEQLLSPMRRAGMHWKSIVIWVKNQSTISGKDYKSRYEPIAYGRFGSDFYGERYNEEDVWEIQRTLKNDLHPTMKPVPLVEKAISNSSLKGHSVLDLFGGSGTTLIACESTQRIARLMELDPKYCDVIVRRWQDFTGKPASLEATGQTFAQVQAQRVPATV